MVRTTATPTRCCTYAFGMPRLLTAFVTVCASVPVLLVGLLPTGVYALPDPMPPAFDGGFSGPAGPGVPPGFVAFFLLIILLGVGTTIWRVSLARQVARDSGMDEDQATAMTLLSDNGLDATYLASNLRNRPGQEQDPASPSPQGRTVNERLRELQQLRDEGLVTYDEYEARRNEILDSL